MSNPLESKMDFLIQSFQAALFGYIDIRDPLEVGHQLKSKTGDLFDGEPLVLPIPLDAPPEIPRLILKSKDDVHSCNVSPERIDLFYREKQPTKKWIDLRDEYLSRLLLISQSVVETLGMHITRLGSVAQFAVSVGQDASSITRKAYLRDGVLPGQRAIQLGVLDRQSLETTEINRWIRLRGQEEESTLHVIVDINTIPEKKYNFDVKGIESFYNYVSNFFVNDLEEIVLARTDLAT